MNQADFMRRAVEISRVQMDANEGGPFGAVIVRDGKIIAEGHNMVTSANDPTAHAEVVAIRNACKQDWGFFTRRMPDIYVMRTVSHVSVCHLLGANREDLLRQQSS